MGYAIASLLSLFLRHVPLSSRSVGEHRWHEHSAAGLVLVMEALTGRDHPPCPVRILDERGLGGVSLVIDRLRRQDEGIGGRAFQVTVAGIIRANMAPTERSERRVIRVKDGIIARAVFGHGDAPGQEDSIL